MQNDISVYIKNEKLGYKVQVKVLSEQNVLLEKNSYLNDLSLIPNLIDSILQKANNQ